MSAFCGEKDNAVSGQSQCIDNRVGGKRSSFFSYFRFPTSHTTVRAVRHTAVPILGSI